MFQPFVLASSVRQAGHCAEIIIKIPHEKSNALTPSDVISSYRVFFTNTIANAIANLKERTSLKIWPSATVFVVKPPESEITIRFYNLDTSFFYFMDSEINRILDVWIQGFTQRVEVDTELRSGMSVVGTDKIAIQIGCYYKKQKAIKPIKGHKLKNFGRGRRSLFDPSTTTHCLIYALKAHNYLKTSTREFNSDLAFELNNLILPNNDCGLIYEYRANGYEMDDIGYLEESNNMCIHVYCMNKEKEDKESRLVIARVGNKKYENIVHLLLVEDESHVCLIIDFDKFMAAITRSNDSYFCNKCLWSCKKDEIENIERHNEAYCYNMNTTLRFPEKGDDNCILKFEKTGKTYPDRCFAVFDTESYLKKTNTNPNVISTHKTIAWCYIIIERVLGPICERYYVGPNAADLFLHHLERDWRTIRARLIKYPLDRNERAKQMLASAVACLICKSDFNDSLPPVQHHDHSIPFDNIISILCSKCNMKLHDQKKVLTVVGHNSNRYDINLLLRECKLDLNLKIHNKSGTQFHYLKNKCLKFIDAYAHLPASLEKLAELHVSGNRPIPCVRYLLEQIWPDAHELLITGKQGFFYEYLDDPSKLNDRGLPSREESYSSLTNKIFTVEEYEKIRAIWDSALCITLRDLLIIYLKIDTAFLGDIVSSYRKDFYSHLKLDAIAHASSASLAWNSMLNYSQVELELITSDISWFSTLISDNIRGGLAQGFKSIISANNESCSDFDPRKPKSFIYQFDMNALYSFCETHPLPTGNFKVEPPACLGIFAEKLKNLETVNTPTGFYLQVDVMVPVDVARRTDQFPLIINNMKVTREMLSPYQLAIIEKLNIKFVPSQRLLASHIPANKILMSAILLQKLMTYGLVVTKVHMIISFDQRAFMKEYIQMNIDARTATSDPVLKNLLKLCNNSIFGRSIFNVTQHSSELHLIETPKQFMKRVMSPFFRHAITLSEYRMMACTYRKQILQTSPLFLGFSILEISKSIMYNFYYGVIKEFYGNRVINAYTDTDCLILHLTTDSFENDVLYNPEFRKWFDFSNFPSDHRLYSKEGMGALGRVKNETGGKVIREVVVVRTKNYSILMADGAIKATLKGIHKSKHSEITHEMYKNAVLNWETQSFEFGSIKVNERSVDTVIIRRLGISPFDVKRYMFDAFNSVSHGHPDASSIHICNPRKRTHKVAFKPKFSAQNYPDIELDMEVPHLYKSRLLTVDNIFVDNR